MANLELRNAIADDFDEILRLVHIMIADQGFGEVSNNWHTAARNVFTQGLTNGTFTARVIDDPETPGRLVACAIGIISQRMPAFWLPNGKMGYIQWLFVKPEWRRKGLAQLIVQSLITWFTGRDIERVEVHSTPEAVQ